MEIERKFMVKDLPDLTGYAFKSVSQGYLSYQPEIRIRSMNDNEYYLTQKGDGDLARKEIEPPIDKDAFGILSNLVKGRMISKTRYFIPLGENLKAELDIFAGELTGLITVEVEFDTEQDALDFEIPDWFSDELTYDERYKNKNLARCSNDDLKQLIPSPETKGLKLKKDENN